MTQTLKKLLQRVEEWPPEIQEEAADTLRAIEKAHRGLYELTVDDKKALARSAKDVHLRRFVSAKKLRNFFKTGRA